MITQEQIHDLIGHTLYDSDGDRVGEVKTIYVDDTSGDPEWLTVKTGWFGMHESFVPLRAVRMIGDRVEAGFGKDQIKDAPRVDVESGARLSEEEERELYRHYGVEWGNGRRRPLVPGQPGSPDARTDMTSEDAMTRSEEHLRVDTERYESGHARLRKYVVTQEEQVTVPVSHEEVRIEREPITEANRDAAMRGQDITEAEHEVTLHAERAVVETEAVPVERVRLAKEEVTEDETVSRQVRKERIEADGDLDGEPERKERIEADGDVKGEPDGTDRW
ncbi:DUF2382 domain-containing protein [Nonomuraea sp. NPDC050394]|uniref:DUF2382 domain-containing protein n=1 Tax=Nonomuraea sp. NPDC050394 TaxID=3364363 RepID=UPI0037BD31C5